MNKFLLASVIFAMSASPASSEINQSLSDIVLYLDANSHKNVKRVKSEDIRQIEISFRNNEYLTFAADVVESSNTYTAKDHYYLSELIDGYESDVHFQNTRLSVKDVVRKTTHSVVFDEEEFDKFKNYYTVNKTVMYSDLLSKSVWCISLEEIPDRKSCRDIIYIGETFRGDIVFIEHPFYSDENFKKGLASYDEYLEYVEKARDLEETRQRNHSEKIKQEYYAREDIKIPDDKTIEQLSQDVVVEMSYLQNVSDFLVYSAALKRNGKSSISYEEDLRDCKITMYDMLTDMANLSMSPYRIDPAMCSATGNIDESSKSMYECVVDEALLGEGDWRTHCQQYWKH